MILRKFQKKRRLGKIRAPDGIWTHDLRDKITWSRKVVGSNPIWGSDFSESTFLLEKNVMLENSGVFEKWQNWPKLF